MTDQDVVVSREEFEAMQKRIDELEAKLADNKTSSNRSCNEEKKTDFSKVFGDVETLVRGVLEASVEAFGDMADAVTKPMGNTDKEKVGDVPAMFINTMSRMLDMQRTVLDKFRETLEKK